MAKGRKTGGRVKGSVNIANGEVEARCRQLLEDPEYQAYFKHRLAVGQLAPALEIMTWGYAFGRPIDRHVVSGPDGGAIPFTWQPPQIR